MENNKKKEILEMLANKEISKEEAEKKLAKLGDSGETEPAVEHQSAPTKKSNTGCIIAIIIAVVLLPILLVVLGALFLVLFKASEPVEVYRVPEAYEIQESVNRIEKVEDKTGNADVEMMEIEEEINE